MYTHAIFKNCQEAYVAGTSFCTKKDGACNFLVYYAKEGPTFHGHNMSLEYFVIKRKKSTVVNANGGSTQATKIWISILRRENSMIGTTFTLIMCGIVQEMSRFRGFLASTC